ncbi:MAG: hypothetical protein N2234_00760 [Planctomycetota bacterium]|nr:hypothetical protein [Planctomycetota bacterium]
MQKFFVSFLLLAGFVIACGGCKGKTEEGKTETAPTPPPLQVAEGFIAPELILPKDSVMAIMVSDCSSLKNLWNNSFVNKVAAEPDVKKVIEKFTQKMGSGETKDPFKLLLGVDFEQMTGEKIESFGDVFKGAVGLSLLQMNPREGPRGVRFLFAVETKEKKPLLEKVLQKFMDKIAEENKGMHDVPKHSTYDYEGVTIHTFGNEEVKTYGVFVGTVWLFSLDEQILKDAILRCKNLKDVKESSLARDAIYSSLRSQLSGGKAEILFFIDYGKFLSAADLGAPNLETAEAMRKMREIYDFKTLLAVLRTEKGIVEQQVMDWSVGAEITKLVERPSVNKMLTESENILAYGCAALNFKMCWDIVLKSAGVVNLPSSPVAQFNETIKGLEQKLRISFDELLSVFGEQFEFYVAKPLGGGAYPEFFFTVALKEPQKLSSVLDNVVKSLREETEKRGEKLDFSSAEYKGIKLSGVDLKNLLKEVSEELGEKKMDIPYELSWALSDKTLVVASSPQTLKGVLDAIKSPFEAKGALKQSLLSCPEKINGFSYIDTPALTAYLYNTFLPLVKENLQQLGLELADMPDVKTLTKHIPQVWAYGTVDGKMIKNSLFTSDGSGFTFSVVPLTIFSSIIINLMAARPAAAEATVQVNLKMVCSAQEMYKVDKNTYAKSFDDLKEYMGGKPEMKEYEFFILGASEKGFSVVANPKKDSPYKKYYFVNETGVVRWSDTPNVGPHSPPLNVDEWQQASMEAYQRALQYYQANEYEDKEDLMAPFQDVIKQFPGSKGAEEAAKMLKELRERRR